MCCVPRDENEYILVPGYWIAYSVLPLWRKCPFWRKLCGNEGNLEEIKFWRIFDGFFENMKEILMELALLNILFLRLKNVAVQQREELSSIKLNSLLRASTLKGFLLLKETLRKWKKFFMIFWESEGNLKELALLNNFDSNGTNACGRPWK